MSEYAVFSYDSINLGDEIQSLASARLLARSGCMVSCLINRERHVLTDVVFDGHNITAVDDTSRAVSTRVKLLHNGWLDGAYMTWHTDVDALLTSIHINELPKDTSYDWLKPQQQVSLLDASYHDFLRRKQIGCRDPFTFAKVIRAGLNAYMSGCITATLGLVSTDASTDATPRSGIYLVDVELPSLARYVPADIIARAVVCTHVYDGSPGDTLQKFKQAGELLDKYMRAELVITSRLHCALPCLAYGTPVLYYHQYASPADVRYQGAIDTIPVIGRDNIDYAHVVNVLPPYWDLQVKKICEQTSQWIETP